MLIARKIKRRDWIVKVSGENIWGGKVGRGGVVLRKRHKKARGINT